MKTVKFVYAVLQFVKIRTARFEIPTRNFVLQNTLF